MVGWWVSWSDSQSMVYFCGQSAGRLLTRPPWCWLAWLINWLFGRWVIWSVVPEKKRWKFGLMGGSVEIDQLPWSTWSISIFPFAPYRLRGCIVNQWKKMALPFIPPPFPPLRCWWFDADDSMPMIRFETTCSWCESPTSTHLKTQWSFVSPCRLSCYQ